MRSVRRFGWQAALAGVAVMAGCTSSGSGGGGTNDAPAHSSGSGGGGGASDAPARPTLGVEVIDTMGQGVRVRRVAPGSIASKAGVWDDDLIVSFDYEPVPDLAALHRFTGSAAGECLLGVRRGDRVEQLKAVFPGERTKPLPPPPPPPRDVIAEQNAALERQRAQQAEDRNNRQRQQILDRAAATKIPEGAKDISDAEAAGFEGKFVGIFSMIIGEAPTGGLLIGIDSVSEPLAQKGRVVVMPESLYQRLESNGTMGELVRDMPSVVVRLVPPMAGARQPGLIELEVMR